MLVQSGVFAYGRVKNGAMVKFDAFMGMFRVMVCYAIVACAGMV
jgi:hypothetical protein